MVGDLQRVPALRASRSSPAPRPKLARDHVSTSSYFRRFSQPSRRRPLAVVRPSLRPRRVHLHLLRRLTAPSSSALVAAVGAALRRHTPRQPSGWCPSSPSSDSRSPRSWTAVDRNSCYVFDDGASMLCFDTLSETAEPIASSPVAGEKPPPEDRNG
ncbi:hypothetical protein ZWY2020_033569 [Hordeum vulgare]|nr:hypothetical protein ZWY2020_033569 [Hordeum vulgare]